MKSLQTYFLTLVVFCSLGFIPQQSTSLILNVTGFKSDNGKLLVQIFNKEEGFPSKPENAFRKYSGNISGKKAQIVITDLPAGEYALSVLHDENNNHVADKNWLGIPKEGLGASNNAKGSFGPPEYKDAKFKVGAGGVIQTINLFYL